MAKVEADNGKGHGAGDDRTEASSPSRFTAASLRAYFDVSRELEAQDRTAGDAHPVTRGALAPSSATGGPKVDEAPGPPTGSTPAESHSSAQMSDKLLQSDDGTPKRKARRLPKHA